PRRGLPLLSPTPIVMTLASSVRPLLVGGALLLGLACGGGADDPPRAATPSSYDWHIRGGTVVDGTGAPARDADVLIRGDTIAHVGPVDPDTVAAAHTFDASGLHVTPGFIDPHAHGAPTETPRFRNFLAMGVTTIVLGQDGGSPEAAAFADRLAAVQAARPAVNVGYLVGHNTLRREAGIGYDTPTAAERRALSGLVEQGLDAGALGLSTGLEYDPGTQARMPELVALAAPVADRDAVVMSHMRSEDAADIEESVAELLEQGRRTGAHVHAAHLKIVLGDDTSQAAAVLDQMAAARRAGRAVTADVYPYTASFTGISILFPAWARPPNDYETVRETRGEELRTYLTNRVNQRNGPDATLLGTGRWTGMTLAEVADSTDRAFADVLVDLGPNGPSAAYFVMDEAVMKRFLAAEHTVVSSDGSPTMHHPRGHGAFARVLDRYVGPDALLSVEAAVHKMTGRTASILDLDEPARDRPPRGLVREGFAADLLAFDPGAVQDRATFTNPHRRARGMTRVWVNGTATWAADSMAVSEGAGTVLRARSTP
ncbi:MAG: amidohydrolase family protein, partial [Salinivenus sp.]